MEKGVKLLKLLNAFAFLSMIAINALAQILPLGGLTTAEISNLYPTLITPAGITFSIWIVIYMLAACFVIKEIVSKKNNVTSEIGLNFAVTCVLNILWIIFWHYQLMLFATIAIVMLFIFLARISKAIGKESLLARALFSIYFAWITVAMAAQAFIYMSLRIPALHLKHISVTITVIMLLALTIFGAVKVILSKDPFFGITICWSLAGVFINHVGKGYNGMYKEIVAASGLMAVMMMILLIVLLIRVRKNAKIVEAKMIV